MVIHEKEIERKIRHNFLPNLFKQIDSLHTPQVEFEKQIKNYYKYNDEFNRLSFFSKNYETLRNDIEYALAKSEKMSGMSRVMEIHKKAGEEIEKIDDKIEKYEEELKKLDKQEKAPVETPEQYEQAPEHNIEGTEEQEDIPDESGDIYEDHDDVFEEQEEKGEQGDLLE